MRRISIGLLIFAIAGCGTGSKATSIPIEKVPENLMTIAKEKLPGVSFDQAIQLADGRIEIIGKDEKGKVREIEFSPSGEIFEIE